MFIERVCKKYTCIDFRSFYKAKKTIYGEPFVKLLSVIQKTDKMNPHKTDKQLDSLKQQQSYLYNIKNARMFWTF